MSVSLLYVFQVVPVLVCSHISVIQCLLAYFRNIPVKECTSIEVPLHTLIELVPTAGGEWYESHVSLLDGEKKCYYWIMFQF
mmetsp:Transcript_15223/g.34088  ORF Transcript_15223/g.34088 Transcript_15223/m.34088 type:complete len:82 (-) Transcript_15223:1459-1704(-)